MNKAQNFRMEFSGVSCLLFWWVLLEALGFLGGLIFASILSACSLEILSTQNPLPAASPTGIVLKEI